MTGASGGMRARGLQRVAVPSSGVVRTAAREGQVMTGNGQEQSAKTLEPVVCEQAGLCVGCSEQTQYALHVDVGTVDATVFVCWMCLMRLGRAMDCLRQVCETQEIPDA